MDREFKCTFSILFSCPEDQVAACRYIQLNTHEATKGFRPHNHYCSGDSECQFRTLDEAKQFCNKQPNCSAILHHFGANDCGGGHGCFTPRKGALKKRDADGGSLTLKKECG